MLFALIASVVICLLQQGVGQDINSLSVCVNLESNYLLVEWQPPFPRNVDTLDVHCSSLNDSFANSFTVRLTPQFTNTIAVQVPVHGGGVHLGYVYVVQATLKTTDGIQIQSDPITIVADYFQDIYWVFKSSNSVGFHCMLATSCSRVVGGCMVSLMRETDGHSINKTIQVVGREETVEGSFDNLDLSEPYLFTATAVRRDLMTPLGRAVTGIIPAVTFNNISRNVTIPMPSVTSTRAENPATSELPTVISSSLQSSLTSSLSTTSFLSSTRSVLLSLSSSVQSSLLITMSTSPVIKSTSSSSAVIAPRPSTSTGTGRDVTSGRTQTSSKKLPPIAIIGIICGIVLLCVGIFALILMILSRLRPQRRSSGVATIAKQQRSMFWPFNVLSSKRNGELHPSINVECTLATTQHNMGTTDSSADTSGYVKMASRVQKQSVPAEYEVPIKSPPPKTSKAPMPVLDRVDMTLYEMPTVPNQTAYLTEDFKKRPA